MWENYLTSNMTARNVKGIVYQPTNQPWTNLKIDFILMSGSYTADIQFPPKTFSVFTDAVTGAFKILLWCNVEGLIDSLYECRLGYEIFKFRLSADSVADIQISDLRNQTITPIPPIVQSEYNRTFNNSDITLNKIRIDHNLNIPNGAVDLSLFTDTGLEVWADVNIINSNSCYLDLTGYTPITGTWKVRVK